MTITAWTQSDDRQRCLSRKDGIAMTGSKNPMSPAVMRDMGVKLIERAAEIELQNRRAATKGENVVHLDPVAYGSQANQQLEVEYPLHALAAIAKGMSQQRHSRNSSFGLNLTNEPAWDMLLYLFVEHTAGKRVITSSACLASNVPTATALRHIKLLEQEGLLRRYTDLADPQATYVEITRHAYRKMAKHLNQIYEAFSHATDIARASFSIVN
jgi:DNA-binding MarR family transcriptional regulator